MHYAVNPSREFRERMSKLGLQGMASPRDDAVAYPGRETPGSGASRPVLLAVDDEPEALEKIERELRGRYGEHYRVVCETSAEAAMERLGEFERDGQSLAVVLADHWMPGMSGVEFLTRVREIHPTAMRGLMVGRGDRTAPEPIVQAMSLGRIDYYLTKPWGESDERFHRVVSEFLYDWAKDRLPKFEDIRVVGEQWAPRSHELRDLLARNGVQHSFHPADSEEGRDLLARVGHESARLPVLVFFDGQVLVNPSNGEIAEACGVNPDLDPGRFDLIVIGAGPAGLAAAVYGASEGLDTLISEGQAVGGQAGTSSLIRNYLGFPQGIGGAELARRAAEQAWLFGGTFVFMYHATSLRRDSEGLAVGFSCGRELRARAVIVATGASYRRLDVPSLDPLHGAGVFYGAAVAEARAMQGEEVYVVGAGNSAGQAAMHLSKYASRVTLLIRGGSLAASMSRYLIDEIEAARNIEVRNNTRVVDGSGAGRLERLVLEDSLTSDTETVPAAGLFILIGAKPHTGWLPEEIERDEAGFIFTGRDLPSYGRARHGWHLGRLPLQLETSMPGVFAVGDVRHGSVKRVASAVGEGSIAIHGVHEYLASTHEAGRQTTDALHAAGGP